MTKDQSTSERMPLEQARAKLAKLWCIGAGIPFVILIVLTILGKFRNEATRTSQVQEAWSWFIPTTLPNLALMIGILGAAALSPKDTRVVKREFYDITWWLSLAYLSLLSLTLLLEPVGPYQGIELLTLSNYWLAPAQGLVVAALGFLFTAEKGDKASAEGKPADSHGDEREDENVTASS